MVDGEFFEEKGMQVTRKRSVYKDKGQYDEESVAEGAADASPTEPGDDGLAP